MTTVSLFQVSKILGQNRVSRMAPLVGLHWPPPPTISLDNLVHSPETLQTQSYSYEWTTPSGVPLGGRVNLTVRSDGTYTVDFETWNSAALPGVSLDFQIRAYLSIPGLPILFFYHAGSVGSNMMHPPGTDSHQESGTNPLIQTYWNQIVPSANFSVAKDYQWSVVDGFNSLVDDILDLGAEAIGATLGAVIALTAEALSFLKLNLGPGGTIGVIAGVVVFAIAAIAGFGLGAAVMLGTVAGVAAGVVSNDLIKSRPMTSSEIQIAQEVFGSQLNYQNVTITNLCGVGGRAFTAPGVDGRTYCNLGNAYANTAGSYSTAYPSPSELMIHELTHAWQIQHNSFMPGFVCSAVVNQTNYIFGDNVYAYGAPGPPWSSFNLEQQAQIVNQWFAGDGNSVSFGAMSTANPYYQYIADNILTGSAGYSNSWL
jgi:hypothetical protein